MAACLSKICVSRVLALGYSFASFHAVVESPVCGGRHGAGAAYEGGLCGLDSLGEEPVDGSNLDVAHRDYETGVLHLRQHHFREALLSFKRSSLLRPDKWQPHVGIARAFTELGDAIGASREYSAAARLAKAPFDKSSLYLALGNSYWSQSRYRVAASAYSASLRYDRSQAAASYGLGLWAAHCHNPDAARNSFLLTARNSKSPVMSAKAHAALGKLDEEVGDLIGARSEYMSAISLDKGNDWARSGLRRVLIGLRMKPTGPVAVHPTR